MADHATTRTSRSSDVRENHSRDKEKREMTFDPMFNSEMLPTPDPQDGIDFRYVRITARGEVDSRNYTNARRAGWEPVHRQEVPELDYVLSDANHPLAEQVKDAIIIGGLILCKRDAAIGVRMQEMANNEMKSQIRALNENYMNEGNDPRVKKFSDNRSSVRFGD